MADFQQKLVTTILAGGGAGLAEAVSCQPLDTIKTRMQLLRGQKTSSNTKTSMNLVSTARSIVQNEGFRGLYRGLSAVSIGMGPKIAIRFGSFETYKSLLRRPDGTLRQSDIFAAGLGAGVTEAVCVVNAMEVVKIRIQSARAAGAVMTAGAVPAKVTLIDTAWTIVHKEGPGALLKGVELTALRQGTNQAANFTMYNAIKTFVEKRRGDNQGPLPGTTTAAIGLVSGAFGPMCNAPIDTIKSRLQSASPTSARNVSRSQQVWHIMVDLIRNEGPAALYKGLTPRILRVAPGQAVTWMTYESLSGFIARQYARHD